MPRRRVPTELARVTGAAIRNPGRFAGRTNPRTGELGNAPAWLSPAQVAAFEVLREAFPWLQRSDRILVGLAATILARVMAGEDVGMTAINQLRLQISQMGGSPTDLSKIAVAEEREPDPLDIYFK
jgi:hypothetical protein